MISYSVLTEHGARSSKLFETGAIAGGGYGEVRDAEDVEEGEAIICRDYFLRTKAPDNIHGSAVSLCGSGA
jgi:hypothetical protein